MDFLRQHNIHYVAHDEIPYNSAGAEDIYAEVKKQVKYIYETPFRECSKLPKEQMVSLPQILSLELLRIMTCTFGEA